ncbi:MAG: hypothetical protein MPK62_00615 [Alphaproteobacteria bacterium]|nr:hypothetical protein [Alphaproteobacteria bacterium]MDA8029640.1 hypothetical protein [Alphaproteobacteria bacterium]
MSRYEDYSARVADAIKNGDHETARFYTGRMWNIEKCRMWREKRGSE